MHRGHGGRQAVWRHPGQAGCGVKVPPHNTFQTRPYTPVLVSLVVEQLSDPFTRRMKALPKTWCEWKRLSLWKWDSTWTLRTALVSKNPGLVSQSEKTDAAEWCLANKDFQPASDPFRPITLHSPSDWITSHPEPPQDFEGFLNDPSRKTPAPEKRSIYIQCIGSL